MMARPTPIEPDGIFEGIDWRAVVCGVVLDVLLTGIVFVPLYTVFGGAEAFSDDDAIADAAIARAHGSLLFNVLSLAAGGLCTALGGFFGARRAGRHFLRHGGWVAVLTGVLSVALFVLMPAGPRQPFWAEVLGFAILLPAGLLGGAVAGAFGRRVA